MVAPVWVWVYSLLQEFSDDKNLEGIGNTLRSFVKILEVTKRDRYTSYACICIYMDISKPLPDYITLTYHNSDWIQTINYEHLPFHCCKCH